MTDNAEYVKQLESTVEELQKKLAEVTDKLSKYEKDESTQLENEEPLVDKLEEEITNEINDEIKRELIKKSIEYQKQMTNAINKAKKDYSTKSKPSWNQMNRVYR